MDLTPAEKKILADLLVNGDNVSGNISGNTGVTANYVSRLLSDLEAKGFTEAKGNGVYRLTNSGVLVARNLVESYELDS